MAKWGKECSRMLDFDLFWMLWKKKLSLFTKLWLFLAQDATLLQVLVILFLFMDPCLSVHLCLSVTSGVLSKGKDRLICFFLVWRFLSTSPILCFKEVQVCTKMRVLSSGTFSWALELENFGTAFTGFTKTWGHKLMAIILSNLNRITKLFHWKIPW